MPEALTKINILGLSHGSDGKDGLLPFLAVLTKPFLRYEFTMTSSSSSEMNKYWIPHLDIHKKVITQELQYYLGPGATVRPYTREVSGVP